MTSPITIGDITIHRVVEQELPLFDAREFFPTLSAEALQENRSWLEPKYLDPATGHLTPSRLAMSSTSRLAEAVNNGSMQWMGEKSAQPP